VKGDLLVISKGGFVLVADKLFLRPGDGHGKRRLNLYI